MKTARRSRKMPSTVVPYWRASGRCRCSCDIFEPYSGCYEIKMWSFERMCRRSCRPPQGSALSASRFARVVAVLSSSCDRRPMLHPSDHCVHPATDWGVQVNHHPLPQNHICSTNQSSMPTLCPLSLSMHHQSLQQTPSLNVRYERIWSG